jgi:hypothetical protein
MRRDQRPGAARYQPLPPDQRDAYENRILLCANDHVVIDKQPEHWTTERLRRLKDEHEQAMTSRTADGRPDGVRFHMPDAVLLDTVMTGAQLLDIVGPAYAYAFERDELEGDIEHEAAKNLLSQAHDLGEIYSMISPAERIDAGRDLNEDVLDALRDGLLLRGARIDVDVTINGEPDRWPVAILVLRKAVVVAKEQKAAKEAEQALREDGIEGLEACRFGFAVVGGLCISLGGQGCRPRFGGHADSAARLARSAYPCPGWRSPAARCLLLRHRRVEELSPLFSAGSAAMRHLQRHGENGI